MKLEPEAAKGKLDFCDSDGNDVIPVHRHTSGDAPASANPGQVTGTGVLEVETINLKMPVSYGATQSSLKVSAGWVPPSGLK